jgi:hypothetical protein
MQAGGRAAKVAFLRDRDEIRKLPEGELCRHDPAATPSVCFLGTA